MAIFYSAAGLARPSHINDLVLLAGQFVIVNKKFFQLSHELFPQIIDVLDVRPSVIALFDGYDTIVSSLSPFFPCSPSITPTGQHFSKHPGNAGSSINTSTSMGSPSSALVEGTNPKS